MFLSTLFLPEMDVSSVCCVVLWPERLPFWPVSMPSLVCQSEDGCLCPSAGHPQRLCIWQSLSVSGSEIPVHEKLLLSWPSLLLLEKSHSRNTCPVSQISGPQTGDIPFSWETGDPQPLVGQRPLLSETGFEKKLLCSQGYIICTHPKDATCIQERFLLSLENYLKRLISLNHYWQILFIDGQMTDSLNWLYLSEEKNFLKSLILNNLLVPSERTN